MSDRETKTIKVGEVDVKIKTYASALEANNIQNAYFTGSKVELVGDQPKLSEINPNVQFEVEKVMIEQLVVAFGDVTDKDKIIEQAHALPVDTYNALIKELDTLVGKKK